MTLPKFLTPHTTIVVDDQEVDIRGLTRSETARFNWMVSQNKSMAELEVAVIAAGTDTPADEVKAWYETTPSHAVEAVLTAIKDLSRLDEGAQKSSGTGDSAG